MAGKSGGNVKSFSWPKAPKERGRKHPRTKRRSPHLPQYNGQGAHSK